MLFCSIVYYVGALVYTYKRKESVNMFFFVAFRSRTAASSAFGRLKDYGLTCTLFSTPAAANLGCGLSIKFSPSDLDAVKSICQAENGYAGVFRAVKFGEKTVVSRL